MELFLSLPKIMFNVIWSKARKSPPVLLGILVGGHCFLSFPSQLLQLPTFNWTMRDQSAGSSLTHWDYYGDGQSHNQSTAEDLM